MKKIIFYVLLLGLCSATQAQLIDRGGGLIYDTDRNITWLQNANLAFNTTTGGAMTWDDAKAWADNLSFAGYDDWRLPIQTIPAPMYNSDSELGHMFYIELGGIADNAIYFVHNTNYELVSNISGEYWTSDIDGTNRAFVLNFINGTTYHKLKSSISYVWAVRDGDSVGNSLCNGDQDCDGVANAVDNCPINQNPEQTDTDSDGQRP